MVSTLQCQDCFHTSSCHESFLDISLPISIEKPQPPARRKSSPETSPTSGTSISLEMRAVPVASTAAGPSKHQSKKEKEKERKAKRAAKHHNKRISMATGNLGTRSLVGGPDGDNPFGGIDASFTNKDDENLSNNSQNSTSSSSAEQSDADVEDNLLDDERSSSVNVQVNRTISSLYPSSLPMYDSNGNNELPSPLNPEKRDDSPENLNKDNSNDDENGKD